MIQVRLPARRHRAGAASMELGVIAAVVVTAAVLGFGNFGQVVSNATARLLHHQPAEGLAGDQTAATIAIGSPVAPSRDAPTPLAYFQVLLASLLALGVTLVAVRPRKMTARILHDDPSKKQEAKTDELSEALFKKRQEMFKRILATSKKDSLYKLAVCDVMSDRLSPVAPTTSVAELVRAFKEQRRHHFLVCDEAGRLLGIISDRDLAHREGRTAADLMTRNVRAVGPDTDLLAAVTMMINHGISALPVMRDEMLVGIMTTRDLMMATQCLILLGSHELQPAS